MASVFLYFAGGQLSNAELTAACLDGHLVAIGEAYTPADTVETAALRAGSLSTLVVGEFALILESAAWVHGMIAEPPQRHRLQRTSARRGSGPMDRMVRYRDTRIESNDLVMLSGVRVANVSRTIVDVVREGEPRYLTAIERFVRQHPGVAESALAWLDTSPRLPNKRTAQTMLTQWATTT